MGKGSVQTAAKGKSNAMEPQGALLAIWGMEKKGDDLKVSQLRNGNFIQYDIPEQVFQQMQGDKTLIVPMATALAVPHPVAHDDVKDFKNTKARRGIYHQPTPSEKYGQPVRLLEKGEKFALPYFPL
jgi:hypothetical protein